MKNFFRSIIPFFARIIPSGEFSPVTYWRHRESKHLYLCMSKVHIIDDERSTGEEKFLALFPKAIRISKMEFDSIIYFFPEMEIVTVADDTILSSIAKEEVPYTTDEEMKELFTSEHEESEDKDINEN